MAYQTIPIDLVEVAECAEAYFREMGFRLSIEKTMVGFPRTPAFVAKRGSSTQIVEVTTHVTDGLCEDWGFYARSRSKDTRVIFCVPARQRHFEEVTNRARENNMGLCLVTNGNIQEICVPHDLTVNISLPRLASLSNKLRPKVGPAYEKFRHGHWQEGFEDLCQIYEQDCREYLTRQIIAGNMNIVNSAGVIKNPTKARLKKMTAGTLGSTYASIKFPTPATALISQTLLAIKQDRNNVVHHKGKRAAEARLRRNINGNIWTVINGLRKFPY